MRLELFSLYDTKAVAFVVPFFLPNVALAVRAIVGMRRDEKSVLHSNPGDFVLYRLGSWNDHSAAFELVVPPERLVLVSEIEGESNEAKVGNDAQVFGSAPGGNSALDFRSESRSQDDV